MKWKKELMMTTRSIRIENLFEPQISKKKGVENERKILQFLLKEKYAISSILTKILGFKNRNSVLKILKRMEVKGLIKKHKINIFTMLYGITNQGVHEAQSIQEKITDWHYFEPSKINPLTLQHQLGIQSVHADCVSKGIDFTPGRELGSRADSDKIADGVININGKKIALEVERHVKSKRRYDAVIYNYLKLIKSGEYYCILYVSDTRAKAEQIKKAMHSISKINMKINGQKKVLKMDPKIHLSYFDFIGLEDVDLYLNEMKNFFCSGQHARAAG
jgi:hypothetical protein